ncbi:MAG TPA: hypothetical protein VMW72_07035 [Sedimentisphaerales bacterium]|nr:hypothetical protein [Sedimentisphaerales bacterium]
MSNCNENFAAGAVSPTSEAHISFVHKTSHIIEPSNAHLANIGVELLKPPADLRSSAPVGAKILPPIPAALFMVLTGFLCVSLVKDRRLWLAALAGLLWAGQAGFHAIPQLAAHMNSQKHIQRKTPDNTACLYRFEDCCRLRSDIEGTQYIGLLHRLAAIPAGTMSLLLPASLPSLQEQRSNLIAPRKRVVSALTKSNTGVLQFAITRFSSLLDSVVICPAARAEQYIHFSPAYTFAQLARGPPDPGLIIVTSFLHRGSLRAGPSGWRLM